MEESFNDLYKEFRNRLRPFRPDSIVTTALEVLREPFVDKLEALERLPWQVMLLVKWALQDPMCSDASGRRISRNEFDRLRNAIRQLADRMRPLEANSLFFFMRRLLYQQLSFQKTFSAGFAREAALLGRLTAEHPLRVLFKDRTGLTPEEFLDLSLALYAIVTDGKQSIPYRWFRNIAISMGVEPLRAYIDLVSKDYSGLKAFCRGLPDGDRRVASEYFEFTPIRRFPLLRIAESLECWHPMIFYRGMEAMVHSVMSEAGAAYMEPFSRLFEKHVLSELEGIGCQILRESDLRSLCGEDQEVPDALLSLPDANIFVEAKAGLFEESVMVAGHREILRHKTKSLGKAITQGWAASVGIRRALQAPRHIREAQTHYLLVITNRELHAASGARLQSMYPDGKLEYPSREAEQSLPLAHVYVLSVDDFERLVAAAKHDQLDLRALLAKCIELDSHPQTSRFTFSQHLDAQRVRNGRSRIIEDALDQATERMARILPA